MFHSDIILKEWQLLDDLLENNSAPINLTGHSLTIAQIIYIARYGGKADISSYSLQSMLASSKTLERKLQEGDIIYGVNTGFGGSADLRTKKPVELQNTLIREFLYGILPKGTRDPHAKELDEFVNRHQYDLLLENSNEPSYLAWSWTRAAVLIRINSLIKGVSAVRPVVVNRLHDVLKHDIMPMIPLRGSISASGDLSPLAYIAATIQGKPSLRVMSKNNQSLYADVAFMKAGLEPVKLQAKEGLAIVNGTAISAAASVLAIHDTNGLALLAQILTAMSVEALSGTDESFHPFFAEVRPHPGQIESSRNMFAFLKGSKITKVNDGTEASLRQDRYSIRTAPQWIGPVLEDLVLAHQQISIECNSATDNPLVTPGGEFLHGGNFQAKAVSSAMEKTRQGVQSIGRMLFCQCTEMINPSTSRGLPPNLVFDEPSSSFIFKGMDIGIAALLSELGFLANPVNHVQTAEMGNQSLNSLALISTRYTHMSNDVLSQLMATHLLALCQALDLRAMHSQFLELYRPLFFALVAEKYGVAAGKPNGKPLEPLVVDATNGKSLEPLVVDATNGKPLEPLVADATNGKPLASLVAAATNGNSQKPLEADELSELLWSHLQKSFDMTVSLDPEARFPTIAKSLRTVYLDHANLIKTNDFFQDLEEFTGLLATSLEDAWCPHRDAYLVHGDATPFLGMASKRVYTFIRKELKVPLLCTSKLKTPEPGLDKDTFDPLGEAPNVGSYTAIIYRALRDGTLAKVAIDILKEVRK